MSVHYKFKSALDYDTVTFDGLHISVGDLKKAIIQQKRIGKNTDFDLQVTNAQTKEVYNDENALIPKNTSLIIARVPLAAQPNKGRTWNDTSQSGFPSRGNEDSNPQALSKAVDLSRLDASEEDKIRAMMTQSTLDYDPSNYMKIRGSNQMGEVPANYRCYKCHQPGHWIKNCPLGLSQEPVEIKKSTGIPRSFMVPVEGPMVPGAMMTPTGQYAVPALDHQAYNSDGGGRGEIETEQRPDIPEDLLCSICKDLLTDAVMIPCCGNSFCDECIRTTLLESEDHECPDCHEKDISPGTLIPNRFLRNSVSNFRNETGYRKRPQYKPVQVTKPQVESSTMEEVSKPQKVELPDFVPPSDDSATKLQQDQKPIISEADSTEQTLKHSTKATVPNDVKQKLKEKEELKSVEQKRPEQEQPPPKKSYPQVIVNMLTGEVQPKVTSSQPVQDMQQVDTSNTAARPQYRQTVATTHHTPVQPNPTYTQAVQQNEERPGTPTIDEPGIIASTPAATHQIPAYPPGDTPPFMSPPDQAVGTTVPQAQASVRPTMLPVQHGSYPPAGYPPQGSAPPYAPGYPAPPAVRRPGPPPPQGAEYNPHPRPYLPRMPYEQVRPPAVGPYDPARPPPPQSYPGGFPPRPGGPHMPGPRPPYGPPLRNPPPGIRPPLHNPGVIDDPLAAFERMLREKDERDRRVRESRRSRSRSYSPRSRRTRSSSRSRSYSPRSRSPRSRSPPPKPKIRNRSRTPRSISRSRSRSRGSVLRRSRTPRSRDRSFSLSRSRSYSRSPSPREYSPRRRPLSRNRYRSPPPRTSPPPRYNNRYTERRGQGDRDRGLYNPPPRERDYGGSYYEGQPPMDYPDRDRGRINDRDKEYDRGDNRGGLERERNRRMPLRGLPRPPGGRYLPSPMRKEYPLVPQNQPTYYTVQEHAVYHSNQPNRLPPSGPGRMGGTYPPALMSVKTVMPSMESRNYEPPAPPGTEEPTVPGFESPRLMMYERAGPNVISDAPPGVDPHSSDTVLTKPSIEVENKISKDIRSNRDPQRDFREQEPRDPAYDKNRVYEYNRDRERRDRDKKVATPTDWKHSRASNSPNQPAKEKHTSKSPDRHRYRHRYESPEKERDRDRERQAGEEKSNDKRNKDSSEDDKSKSKSKDKKKKRKEKEKEREAEKSKKKEEKKKRKEQEKLEKLKKAEEKKNKSDTENIIHEKEKEVEEKEHRSSPKVEHVEKKNVDDYKKPDDLYGDVLTEGIDTKVVQNYGKLKTDTEPDTKIKLSPVKNEKLDTSEEKETSFDGLDLYVNVNDIIKPENEGKTKSKEVLAPLPALSKWEVEEEGQNDKKESNEETVETKAPPEKSSTKVVTSEVLKHAENAIFKKAINAIRPIEIKKISLDRAKLYSGEKSSDTGLSTSPTRTLEKESITPASIQVTIPTSDWEMRLVDINPSTSCDQRRSEREIPSAVQKPAPTRLSVRERLGSKVDELDKLTKEDRHFDRNRSRTLSPLSRRERDESSRNVTDSTRRVVEVEENSRRGGSRHNWNRNDRDRKQTRVDRSRSRERGYRDSRRNDNRRMQYRRDDSRRDDRDRRDRDYDRYDSRHQTKKGDKRVDSKNDKRRDDKHRERDRKSSKYSRSRSTSRDRRSSDKSKTRKKDKKHKKDKEKGKKYKKDEDSENKKQTDKPDEESSDKEKKTDSESKETTTEKKITERRKPTLDEANFEPDYDALDTESESDNENKGKNDKKRERSKSPDDDSFVKKRKVVDDPQSKKTSKSKEVSSSSDSSSDSSSSEEERTKRKHKKHKKRKSTRKASSSSSSNSASDSSSDEESKKRKNKSKKHKSRKAIKKKKKSKHRVETFIEHRANTMDKFCMDQSSM